MKIIKFPNQKSKKETGFREIVKRVAEDEELVYKKLFKQKIKEKRGQSEKADPGK